MAFAVLAAVGCQKTGTKTISVNVKIDEAKLEAAGVPAPESYDVKLSNFSTGAVVEVQTENGIATAEGIVPGVYSVTASGAQVVGGFNYTIAGANSNVSLLNDNDEVTVAVEAVKEAALVFKEIYYTGCSFPNIDPATGKPIIDEKTGEEATSTYFRDQFYEIYNNSTEVVYADSLCICTTIYASDFTDNLVYQWPIKNPDQYVFTGKIWQIPGDGTKYPIQPGESIVIAQWGTNHKAKTLTDGHSPVDLSGAEFEALEKEGTTWDGIVLTDNNAINMAMAVNASGYNTPQWLTPVGGARYVLFRPAHKLKNEDFLTPTNDDYGTSNAREVPIAEVIDAVQSVDGETGMNLLGLPTVLDAGGIWCSGSYVGESIARKIKETREDGTIVYQDTNNTTNDFEVKTDPQVRRNGAKVPSWNTWIK